MVCDSGISSSTGWVGVNVSKRRVHQSTESEISESKKRGNTLEKERVNEFCSSYSGAGAEDSEESEESF
ncbi:hypothetical protein M8J77_012468 [Diaphorina citri]|nr:hypothetical protein M8J77_012468 [Diaphorina citri]